MKKFKNLLCVLLLAVLLVLPNSYVDAKTTKKTTTTTTQTTTTGFVYEKTDDEKAVNIYIFYQDGCPRCRELHTYLSELKNDKDMKDKFNVVDYNIKTSTNYELMESVQKYFSSDATGVPYYVIGTDDYEGFLDDTSHKSNLRKAIEDAYGSKNYKDVVAAIVADDVSSLDDNNNVIGMIILGICVVIIIALIVCSSKNKYYDEEDEETEEKTAKEEKHEEVKEEKEDNKKQDTKETSKTKKKKK